MRRQKVGDYTIFRDIGEGGFAKVVSAVHNPTGISVAMKIIPKVSPNDDMHTIRIQRELSILKKVKHPFICQLYEIVEDDDYYYLAMEFVQNGNLLEIVNSNGRFSESVAASYVAQVISVLLTLHEDFHIAHRDLKAENVLLDRNRVVRVIDFGLSNEANEQNSLFTTACGSPAYASPEMIRGETYSYAADTWSLGILIYAICAGHLPFDDPNIQKLMNKIVYGELECPPFFSRELTELLTQILNKNPNERPSLREVLANEWFRNVTDIGKINLDSIKINEISVEEAVVEAGFDIEKVKHDLANEIVNTGTVSYQIIRREKITAALPNTITSFQTTPATPMVNFTKVQKMPTMPFGQRVCKPVILVPNSIQKTVALRRRSMIARMPK